jgi:hypothetical protein
MRLQLENSQPEGRPLMTTITESQLKAALSEINKKRYENLRTRPRTRIIRRAFEKDLGKLQHGIDGQALEQLATLDFPRPHKHVRLNSPFLIWAWRADPQTGSGYTRLQDSHIEPGNSWAKIDTDYKVTKWGDRILGNADYLVFYFLWGNPFGHDVVVNVSSYLMLNGSLLARAYAGFLGFDGGEAELDVNVQLSLFEWWNNPATEPLFQPNQEHPVTTISVTGPIAWLGNTWEDGSALPFGFYPVRYNMFRVPSGGTALFEVALRLYYFDVGNAQIWSDFYSNYPNNDQKVLCPYVDLEILPIG